MIPASGFGRCCSVTGKVYSQKNVNTLLCKCTHRTSCQWNPCVRLGPVLSSVHSLHREIRLTRDSDSNIAMFRRPVSDVSRKAMYVCKEFRRAKLCEDVQLRTGECRGNSGRVASTQSDVCLPRRRGRGRSSSSAEHCLQHKSVQTVYLAETARS